MNLHEQIEDELSLYAMAALVGDERLFVEKHIRECAACRRELERVRGDLALLALSASGPRPPARSRERLMTAIAKEPRRAQVVRQRRPVWRNVFGWAAAVAAITVIVLLLRQNADLRQGIANLETGSANQQHQLLEAKQLLATLTSPEAVHFTLVAGKTPPQPQGKAIYVRSSGTLVFLASNMPSLPPEKTYELWLIPASGAPVPAGLFKPNAYGTATLIERSLTIDTEPKTFAITVEPEAGSSSPTSQPIMVGTKG
jgi:anti-sigma-K factor RskA